MPKSNETSVMHYYEYYPHYMGTLTTNFKVNIELMDELYDAYKKDTDDDNDVVYDKLKSLGNHYAFMDVLRVWPKIRKKLETKGEWADLWEEGSHGISMTNMKDAKHAVALVEAQMTMDEFDC